MSKHSASDLLSFAVLGAIALAAVYTALFVFLPMIFASPLTALLAFILGPVLLLLGLKLRTKSGGLIR